jgi:hypothetical protein
VSTLQGDTPADHAKAWTPNGPFEERKMDYSNTLKGGSGCVSKTNRSDLKFSATDYLRAAGDPSDTPALRRILSCSDADKRYNSGHRGKLKRRSHVCR